MRVTAAFMATLLFAGCATAPAPTPAFAVDGVQDTRVNADIAIARQRIEAYFGMPFEAPVRISVAGDRATFDSALPVAWGIAPTQCWMVGVGVADSLYLLAPSAWAHDACEHDARDDAAVQGIITHELTHAFHGQHNPTRDFTGMDDAGWFVEGLAVLVAGQMTHEASAADAIAAGAAPTTLADGWSGRYKYGVSGSMAAYIDAVYGRATLTSLLDATSNEAILARLHVTEAQFLERWRAWVTQNAAHGQR